MPKDDNHYPIIAHGELYVEPISKKSNYIPKDTPHEYQEAKQTLLQNIDNVLNEIHQNTEVFLDEKIVCVRMEPKFEAKSYVPAALTRSDEGMEIVGGRKYTFLDPHGYNQSAKLYFVKTDNCGIEHLKNTLEEGLKDQNESWRRQISSVHSFDLLSPEEKIMGFPDSWQEGTVEIVLHPLINELDKLVELFYSISNIPRGQTRLKSYDDGLTFISAKCNKQDIERLKKFNPLRAIHPLGSVEIAPIRTVIDRSAPKVQTTKRKSSITVGVFDGGADDTVPLLKNFVNAIDCVPSAPIPNCVSHGTGVCGTILYGNLAGKTSSQILPVPCVSVDCYRVLPLQDKNDFELYEAIDAIENVVKSRPDIKLYNLSFGPAGAIIDDSISRFTYVLDRLTYEVPDGEANPLFCIAVGNDGQFEAPLNRIQAPADMVNGFGIGAYTFDSDGTKIKAPYSCVGAGREGAKIKPDLLEFGGSLERPFILVGSQHDTLAASAGTSFSSPLVVHKIGKILAQCENITPHMARTLLIHNSDKAVGFSQEEQGFGFCMDDVEDILTCGDKKVTILYSGTIQPSHTVKLPVFAPKINSVKGTVKITWTITTIVDPFAKDTDAYTNNCIVDVFVPHDMTFRFSKKKSRSYTLNLLKDDDLAKAKELMSIGYARSEFPVSHPAKKYWSESELRNSDFKWDTVIHRDLSMRGSSLLNPVLTLHAIGRNGFDISKFKYFVAITIEAKKYNGNLYDSILQSYQNLTPVEIRNVNRVMVDIQK